MGVEHMRDAPHSVDLNDNVDIQTDSHNEEKEAAV
jgi:hypothetical protein